MKNNNQNDRRKFIKTAGAALVAASVPLAVAAQKEETLESGSRRRREEIHLSGFGADPNLSGVFGEVCFQIQLRAELGAGGCGTISDEVNSELNTHFRIDSAVRDINDLYIFQGTTRASRSPEMVGKTVVIKARMLSDDRCSLSLTIEETRLNGLLLPAVQAIKTPIYG